MKILKKIKEIFKGKEKYEMPYIRAVIDFNQVALENGIFDDLNKRIYVYHGNEIKKNFPYSKSKLKILQNQEKIPVYDMTKEKKFEEGEEINPMEVYYEKV